MSFFTFSEKVKNEFYGIKLGFINVSLLNHYQKIEILLSLILLWFIVYSQLVKSLL